MAAAEKLRTAQQLLTKISALSPTSYSGQVDLAGPERTGGSSGGASSSSSHGLGGGLSGGGGAGPFGASTRTAVVAVSRADVAPGSGTWGTEARGSLSRTRRRASPSLVLQVAQPTSRTRTKNCLRKYK